MIPVVWEGSGGVTAAPLFPESGRVHGLGGTEAWDPPGRLEKSPRFLVRTIRCCWEDPRVGLRRSFSSQSSRCFQRNGHHEQMGGAWMSLSWA